jgi:co-chaperonin GroES (HSP10)
MGPIHKIGPIGSLTKRRNSMIVKPMFDELLIEPKQILVDDKKIKLIIPEEQSNIWVQAIVHEVGFGSPVWGQQDTYNKMKVKKGDIILITKDLIQDHLKLPTGFIQSDSTSHSPKYYMIKQVEVRAILEVSQEEKEKIDENDITADIAKSVAGRNPWEFSEEKRG